MDVVDYLKKDHEQIFKTLYEFEDIINEKETDIDYWNLLYVFHNLTDLLFQHEQNKRYIIESTNDYYIRAPVGKMFLDQRKVKGHIRVISQSILSKDIRSIRVALDTDGRMVSTNIKNQMTKEEVILDRLLFLRMGG